MVPFMDELLPHRRSNMQIIGSMSKSTLLAALFALSSLLPANAAAPASRECAPILVSAENIQAPSEEQAVELADRAMRAFMASVRAKSMQPLWNHVSLLLREKFSVAQLDEAFKAFYGLCDYRRSAGRKKPHLHEWPDGRPQRQSCGRRLLHDFPLALWTSICCLRWRVGLGR